MAIEAAQTGLLAPTREWLEELVKMAQDWLRADDALRQFDSSMTASSEAEEAGATAFNVPITKEEVRELLVKRRAAAAVLLENKGVSIGRRERVS